MSFSLFTFPSTRLLFWSRVSPATTAALSRSTRLHEALEFTYLAGGTFRQPQVKFLSLSMMKQVPKFLDELIGRACRLARLTNGREGFLLLVVSFWWEKENLVAAQQQEGLVLFHSIAREFVSSRAEVKGRP
jgi:hypothetical protein